MYNGQKEFRPAVGARKGTCMAKISGEEKQAAEFCITHDRDYALTADLFGFTSQQVYSWVRKYHAAGINSLRHERKCPRELSDWVTENKQLKTVNLKLEMEAVLHRKLQQGRVYYKCLNRTVSQKQMVDEKLAGLITEIYQAQRGIPGYRQMKIILERRYKKKTPSEYVAENVLNREFSSDRQNEKWVTDVTEFKYGSISKAYLSAVPDLYGRNIVAFSLSRRNNTPLVLDTFDQAFQKYPDAKPLLNSDRGVQYTSRSFRKEMKRAEVCHSMSRVGRYLGNAPMEDSKES